MDKAFGSLAARAAKLGVDLDEDQVGALRLHFELLVRANRRLNLTRITDPGEAVLKLYLSSLAPFPALRDHSVELAACGPYLDLGTGAGFPGVPIAVAAPGLHTTFVDSRGKKAAFLTDAVREMRLRRADVVNARGSELTRREPELAGNFGLVTARAVGDVAAVLKEVRDLVRPGGWVVTPKGPSLTEEEVDRGRKAAEKYGFELVGVDEVRVEELTPRFVLLRAGVRC